MWDVKLEEVIEKKKISFTSIAIVQWNFGQKCKGSFNEIFVFLDLNRI